MMERRRVGSPKKIATFSLDPELIAKIRDKARDYPNISAYVELLITKGLEANGQK